MGWIILVALVGQTAVEPSPGAVTATVATTTSTPSVAGDDPWDDGPLSDAELALLAALDSPDPAPAAAPASPDPWSPAPNALERRTFNGKRLTETVARTTEEALRALPGLRGGTRGAPDNPILLNGLVINPGPLQGAWLRADPYLLGSLQHGAGSDRSRFSEDAGGHLVLGSRASQLGQGFEAQAGAVLRSADRAAGVVADAQWGAQRWGARLYGSVQHEDDLRVRELTRTATRAEAGSRFNLGLDLRATPKSWLRVNTQFMLSTESGRDTFFGQASSRALLSSLGVEVGTASVGVSLHAGWSEAQLKGRDRDQEDLQARLQAHFVPVQNLRLTVGGFVHSEQLSAPFEAAIKQQEFAGHSFATWSNSLIYAQAGLRIARLQTGGGGTTSVLPQADLWLRHRGLGLRARAARGQRLHVVFGGPYQVVSSWRFRAGPTLRLEGLWIDLNAGFARIEDVATSVGRGPVNVMGLELEGAARLVQGLHLAFSLAWAEGSVDRDQVAVLVAPNLTGHVALRYSLPARRTYFEVRTRASTPRWPLATAEVVGEDPNYGFVQVGIAGGVDLGAGIRLEANVDNALDRRVRDLDSQTAVPGVDFRVRLSWQPTSG